MSNVLISVALVFICSFVVAASVLGLFPPDPERAQPWRESLAGLISFSLIFSGVARNAVDFLLSWKVLLPPLGTSSGDLLTGFSQFPISVSVSLLASWALPPWQRSKVP